MSATLTHPPSPAAAVSRRPWSLLALLAVAQFMVVLDITIVNVALPAIGASLDMARSDLSWVVTAYILCSGGLLLAGGRAADLLGRRRVLLTGLGLFTAASLACGLAPSPGLLIAARAMQGTGAAMLTPTALSIVTASYTGAQRATALSVWGALASAGVAMGVLLGGVLTTALSWHWVFLVNVPVGLALAVLIPRLVPAFAPVTTDRSLDLRGGLIAVAGLALLVYALSGAADHGWGSTRTLGLLAAAVAFLAGFALAERAAARPLLPPAVWRVRSLATGSVMMLGITGILAGAFFVGSVELQDGLGWSALTTGLAFLPFVAAIAVGVHGTAHFIGRVGSRALLAGGLALVATGATVLALAPDHPAYLPDLLPGYVVFGLGMGLAFPAISITAMSEVAHATAGVASGIISTAHEVGAALGVAILSAVALGTTGAVDYGSASLVTAGAAAALAVVGAAVMPAVRPAPGAAVPVH